jgi:hypothetical protein
MFSEFLSFVNLRISSISFGGFRGVGFWMGMERTGNVTGFPDVWEARTFLDCFVLVRGPVSRGAAGGGVVGFSGFVCVAGRTGSVGCRVVGWGFF